MGLLVILVACVAGEGGDSGGLRDTGQPCVETRTEVGLDDAVGLGFTGRDVANQITHTTTAELVWEDDTRSEVTVRGEVLGDGVALVDPGEPAVGDPAWTCGLAGLALQVQVVVTTAEGLLSEGLIDELRVTEFDGSYWVQGQGRIEQLGGTLEVPGAEQVRLRVGLGQVEDTPFSQGYVEALAGAAEASESWSLGSWDSAQGR